MANAAMAAKKGSNRMVELRSAETEHHCEVFYSPSGGGCNVENGWAHLERQDLAMGGASDKYKSWKRFEMMQNKDHDNREPKFVHLSCG